MPKFKLDYEYIPVPAEFIEKYMVIANGAYVKVYLYSLFLGSQGKAMEQFEIAESLNLLESDVKNAFDYWINEGLLVYSDGTISPAKEVVKSDIPRKKTTAQITNIMGENKELSELLILSQSILGKALNTNDMETLFWMYDELGFTPEVISLLLEYCVSKDKRSVQYAEKVAITWSERGINNLEAITKYIEDEKERQSLFYSLRKLFGILDRPLLNKEEEYLKKWSEELKMGEDMVALAYEYCIMQTSKLSFPYMDTILTNWHAKGIFDIAAAEKEHSGYKTAQQGFNVNKDGTDHSSLESIMHNKFDE